MEFKCLIADRTDKPLQLIFTQTVANLLLFIFPKNVLKIGRQILVVRACRYGCPRSTTAPPRGEQYLQIGWTRVGAAVGPPARPGLCPRSALRQHSCRSRLSSVICLPDITLLIFRYYKLCLFILIVKHACSIPYLYFLFSILACCGTGILQMQSLAPKELSPRGHLPVAILCSGVLFRFASIKTHCIL